MAFFASRRVGLVLLFGGILGCSGLGGLAWKINTDPDFGPLLADTGRAALGPEWIAYFEEIFYGAQDRFDRWRYQDAEPATLWETPPEMAPPENPTPERPTPEKVGHFPPNDIPAIKGHAGKQDGHWTFWAAGPSSAPPTLSRTMIHPDPERSQAVVAVVAMDLTRLDLNLVAGTREPASETVPLNQRPGKIPEADLGQLVAAFNGGWQAVNGAYGMTIGNLIFLPTKKVGCSIIKLADGKIQITSAPPLSTDTTPFQWLRQTPACLAENGVMDSRLDGDNTKRWGSALGGASVVRRSGIGINAEGDVLFYAAGDSLTAQTLTLALHTAGAASIAILDINWSYPRFLTYIDTDTQPPHAINPADSLLKNPASLPGLYTRQVSTRDFFYLRYRPSP